MDKNVTVTTSSCFGNISNDVQAIMNASRSHELNAIYKIWQGWIPLPIAIIGLILSIIYILSVLRAIRQHRVSRKCYVLLINRAAGDTLACIMAIIMGIYAAWVPIVGREAMQTMDVFFFCSFWSAMVSYVALSLIKLYAVWQPLHYRKRITMQRCIYLIALSWVVFAFMVAYAMTVIALVRIPFLNRWSNCRVETCIRYMYRMRNFTVSVVYMITLICFAITVVLLQRARRFMHSFHQKSSTATSATEATKRRSLKQRFPLWKLTINVSTFAFFNSFYVIWAVALLIRADRCFFLKHFNEMMLFLGIVRISLLIRITMDPILAFITDMQIRRSMLSMFGLYSKIKPEDSRKRMFLFGRSDQSEENSSDADLKQLNRQSSRQPSRLTDRPTVSTISTEYSSSKSK